MNQLQKDQNNPELAKSDQEEQYLRSLYSPLQLVFWATHAELSKHHEQAPNTSVARHVEHFVYWGHTGAGQLPGLEILLRQVKSSPVHLRVSAHHWQALVAHEPQSKNTAHCVRDTYSKALAIIIAPSVTEYQYTGLTSEEGGKKFKSTRLTPLITFVAISGVWSDQRATKCAPGTKFPPLLPLSIPPLNNFTSLRIGLERSVAWSVSWGPNCRPPGAMA